LWHARAETGKLPAVKGAIKRHLVQAPKPTTNPREKRNSVHELGKIKILL